MNYFCKRISKADHETLGRAIQVLEGFQIELNCDLAKAEQQVIERGTGISLRLTHALRISSKTLERSTECGRARTSLTGFLASLENIADRRNH